MTEEEAKTKWCPHVRYSWRQDPSSNRWSQSATEGDPSTTAFNPVACRCIGSECMAWRWIEVMFRDAIDSSKAPEGYCGLAGKP